MYKLSEHDVNNMVMIFICKNVSKQARLKFCVFNKIVSSKVALT
jgi:hypothetical protein